MYPLIEQEPRKGYNTVDFNMFTGFDEFDGTVSRTDFVQVSIRSNAETCSHWQTGGLQNLDCPLGLFHVLKVLQYTNHRWGKQNTQVDFSNEIPS